MLLQKFLAKVDHIEIIKWHVMAIASKYDKVVSEHSTTVAISRHRSLTSALPFLYRGQVENSCSICILKSLSPFAHAVKVGVKRGVGTFDDVRVFHRDGCG